MRGESGGDAGKTQPPGNQANAQRLLTMVLGAAALGGASLLEGLPRLQPAPSSGQGTLGCKAVVQKLGSKIQTPW